MVKTDTASPKKGYGTAYVEPDESRMVADPVMKRMTPEEMEAAIEESKRLMNEAAKRLDFLQAAQYRDEAIRLTELRDSMLKIRRVE